MSAISVRLDAEDQALLDMLAPEFGGRSSAIRHALRSLAAVRHRRDALCSFLADWDADEGPVDDQDIATMTDRFGL
jgi:Arc/MetJ-type ribon-helix-helix transcriptional regulator